MMRVSVSRADTDSVGLIQINTSPLYFPLDNKVKIKNLRQCSFSPLAGMCVSG